MKDKVIDVANKKDVCLDEADCRLIMMLSKDSRNTTLKVMGEEINMTGAAVSDRIRGLKKSGIIRGFGVEINADKIWSDPVTGLVAVYLKHYINEALLWKLVNECKYIQKSYCCDDASDHTFLIKAPNRKIFDRVYHKLGALNCVDKVEKRMVLHEEQFHHDEVELLDVI